MIWKILSKILPKSPMWLKIFVAKILTRMMTIDNFDNEIVLFNELEKYIETHGRPTTSSPWYWAKGDRVMKRIEIGRAEMSPYIYDGTECDEHRPRWIGSFEGDMDEGEVGEDGVISLDAKTFPPGTKIIIQVPECPECEENADICRCGFDWQEWTEQRYS